MSAPVLAMLFDNGNLRRKVYLNAQALRRVFQHRAHVILEIGFQRSALGSGAQRLVGRGADF